jgi:hypothetical protein
MTNTWRPEWTVEAFSATTTLRVTFTPSYVQAGSAVASIHRGAESRTFGPYPANGYQGEWEFLARLARGEAEPIPPVQLIDDLRFALAVAHGAAGLHKTEETA